MVFIIFIRNGQSTNITSLAEAEESNQLEQWKPDPDASITMEGDIEARKLALGMNYEYLESTLGIISSVHICASPERAALESSIHIAEQHDISFTLIYINTFVFSPLSSLSTCRFYNLASNVNNT